MPAPRLRLALLAAAPALLLAGCLPTVALSPAPDANNPDCAQVSVRLPEQVDTFERRETDAQATGAWGDPVAVILRCGVEVPGPSTLPCIEIPGTGIHWLRDASEAPHYLFTTYGRDPAISVQVDADLIPPGIALDDVANAVTFLPKNGRECLSLEDSVTGAIVDDDEDAAEEEPARPEE